MGTSQMDTFRPAVIEAGPASQTSHKGKRQHRSLEIKRKIVEETLVAGSSVARVARAHGINANQVFQWRRLYRAGGLGVITRASRLLPVSISEEGATLVSPPADITAQVPTGSQAMEPAPGTIHLEVRKARLRIEGNADPTVLRLLLKALLG